jgi:hypothetical protein
MAAEASEVIVAEIAGRRAVLAVLVARDVTYRTRRWLRGRTVNGWQKWRGRGRLKILLLCVRTEPHTCVPDAFGNGRICHSDRHAIEVQERIGPATSRHTHQRREPPSPSHVLSVSPDANLNPRAPTSQNSSKYATKLLGVEAPAARDPQERRVALELLRPALSLRRLA